MDLLIRKENPDKFYGSSFIGEEEIKEVTEVLKSQSLFRYYGQNLLYKVEEFENELQKFLNVSYTVAVNSGTAALKCALKAIDIQPGDEVIVPSYGFIATAGAVVACGAKPVFADIDYSLNIDPFDVENKITEKTVAIIAVHIMGVSADMNKLKDIAVKKDLYLIEDVAQSFGGEFKGKKLGTIGDIGCLSFQATKILSTGEGGAIITNNEKLFNKAKIYHDQGGVRTGNSFPSYNNPDAVFGENYRMGEVTAAIGIAQLKKIPQMLEHLRNLKKLYEENVSGDLNRRREFDIGGSCGISECFFIEETEEREKIIEYLSSKGLRAHGYYNAAVYENNYLFKDYNIPVCPTAEYLSKRVVWIPITPELNEQDIFYLLKETNNINLKGRDY